ncbi:YtxH domain-containing protein [Arcobacter lanthieri]|uniref:YtxH domain-containing protein n=1 Tax=Aliarcobacter lanthieri TaxID=1355374 RepID=UPI0019223BF5|nr:YtxH domain-containing protein [Aliarcobacter lanthieri]MBL3520755.1 YtxH domain-containing protein [Aliarcobacter lanthieri]
MATNQNNNQQINVNPYDTNINNSRINNNNQSGLNINQNPYINQNVNQTAQNINAPVQQNNSIFNGDFVKGALIGAALTYVLTNKNAQENIFKAFEKGKEFLSAGVEELKERIEDAKASMNATKEEF